MAKRTCECGECPKCKHREYMNAWYRRPGSAERVRGWAKRYRRQNLDAVLEYDRKRWHPRSPEKERARRLVSRALRRGELEVGPCERCGVEDLRGVDGRRLIHAHHDDYSEPFVIRWLCAACHGVEHRRIA